MDSEHKDGKYYPWWMNANQPNGILQMFVDRYVYSSILRHMKNEKLGAKSEGSSS